MRIMLHKGHNGHDGHNGSNEQMGPKVHRKSIRSKNERKEDWTIVSIVYLSVPYVSAPV